MVVVEIKRSLLLFFLFLSVQIANAQGWIAVGDADFSVSGVNYTSIAIDSSGTPYVVFEDGNANGNATVMKYNGSNWVTVGNAGFSNEDNYVLFTSLALNKNGIPYVTYIYSESSNAGPPSVMKYNDGKWQTVGKSIFFTSNYTDYTSIAIDGSGTPYVVYQDEGSNDKATVKKYIDSAWVTVGDSGFSTAGYAALYTSIAIDKSGTPYVVYSAQKLVDTQIISPLTVMKYNGSNWVTVGKAGFSISNARFPSIVIDNSGTPYVAYGNFVNGYNTGKATAMKFDGSNWVVIGGATFSAGNVDWTSLAIDTNNNNLYVIFDDSLYGYKATVMKYDGSNWKTLGSPGFSIGAVAYNSIAIGPNGTPYVAYSDQGNGGKATVMKYIDTTTVTDTTGITQPLSPITPHLIIYPNPASTSINVSATVPMDGFVVYNSEGQEIMRRDGIKTKQATIDLQGWAKGVYILQATIGQQKLVKRFTVLE